MWNFGRMYPLSNQGEGVPENSPRAFAWGLSQLQSLLWERGLHTGSLPAQSAAQRFSALGSRIGQPVSGSWLSTLSGLV